MRNVCESCAYNKTPGRDKAQCVKYGIVIYSPRIYCVAWERKKPDEQVRKQKDGA